MFIGEGSDDRIPNTGATRMTDYLWMADRLTAGVPPGNGDEVRDVFSVFTLFPFVRGGTLFGPPARTAS